MLLQKSNSSKKSVKTQYFHDIYVDDDIQICECKILNVTVCTNFSVRDLVISLSRMQKKFSSGCVGSRY